MADSETVDSTQQVTSKNPTTKPKNPKRVPAGKAIAEKTRQACEAQKKALAEAQVIIANQTLQKKADPVETSADDPPVSDTARNNSNNQKHSNNNTMAECYQHFCFIQWLGHTTNTKK